MTFRAVLLESTALTPTTKHLEWRVDGGVLAFTAGQFLSVKRDTHARAYSIASRPRGDGRFALCLNRVPGGLCSNYLCDLAPGAVVDFSGPFGFFTVTQPVDRHLVFVAAGTGIAPIRAMITDLLANDRMHGHGATLIFGVRHQHTLLYGDELAQLEREHPAFRFVPTLSQPTPDWRGRTGRVQQTLLDLFRGRRDFAAHVCGLRVMVDDVRGLLREQIGLDRKQIRHERYD